MSGNPECFADGISEDIITALSKVSQLFVIARNSAVTLKGRNVLVAGLGVRHVQIGTRVRTTAQLIDDHCRRSPRTLPTATSCAASLSIICAVPRRLAHGSNAVLRDPHCPEIWLHLEAQANYQLRRYPETVALLKPRILPNPDVDASHGLLAGSSLARRGEKRCGPILPMRSSIAARSCVRRTRPISTWSRDFEKLGVSALSAIANRAELSMY